MMPWHDTPLHDCCDGKRGPIVPFYQTGMLILLQVWWSFGAWQAHGLTVDTLWADCGQKNS